MRWRMSSSAMRPPAPVAPAVAINYHACPQASQGVLMSNDAKTEIPENVRVLAAVRGLDRALALAPASVIGAVERGRRIGSFPDEYTPVTELASRFSADPERDA
jgi:hypothetical protein